AVMVHDDNPAHHHLLFERHDQRSDESVVPYEHQARLRCSSHLPATRYQHRDYLDYAEEASISGSRVRTLREEAVPHSGPKRAQLDLRLVEGLRAHTRIAFVRRDECPAVRLER